MSNQLPNITVIIAGMIALFFDENDGQVAACQAGVLRDAPGHIFEAVITRMGNPPQVTTLQPIENELRLEVCNTGGTGVSFRNMDAQIDRLSDTESGDPQSFKWALDFEGDELYGREVGADRSRFRSILSVNGGELFTHVVSTNKLLARSENDPPGEFRTIGKVATEIGIEINLDRPESRARFYNGTSQMFEVGPDDHVEIVLKRIRPPVHDHHGANHNEDANFYYSAVGMKLGPGEKQLFSSTQLPAGSPPASPEAACLVGKFSKSRL